MFRIKIRFFPLFLYFQSTIIRMMHLFLGHEVFFNGVSNYLNKYRYKNAEQDNLWEALTEEAHKNEILEDHITVKQIMDTWTLQTGKINK